MSISKLEFNKRKIPNLANVPRDIFLSLEGIAGGAGVVILTTTQLGGWGFDLDITNLAVAANPAILTIDNSNVVTLAPGQRFSLQNVIFTKLVISSLAGACNANLYMAGISLEALEGVKIAS